jgi:histone H3/H4
MADEQLPSAHIKRIVKAKLAELAAGDAADKKARDISVQKEALTAFAESAKIFIHYLTATANDICHDAKRLTINADDVMRAVDEVEFGEFAEPLKEALAGARRGRLPRAWRGAARVRAGFARAAFAGKSAMPAAAGVVCRPAWAARACWASACGWASPRCRRRLAVGRVVTRAAAPTRSLSAGPQPSRLPPRRSRSARRRRSARRKTRRAQAGPVRKARDLTG